MTTLLYFAWVRDAMGRDSETLSLPQTLTTLSELIDWLAARGDHVFAEPARLRAAIDQRMADFSASIVGAREIAFFPPVTGG